MIFGVLKDIKEGEKKQVNKTIREIDGVKYIEYTYITKLKGGKIHKQIVKSKYTTKKKEPNSYDLEKNSKEELTVVYYMESTVGNEAKNLEITVDLFITISEK